MVIQYIGTIIGTLAFLSAIIFLCLSYISDQKLYKKKMQLLQKRYDYYCNKIDAIAKDNSIDTVFVDFDKE